MVHVTWDFSTIESHLYKVGHGVFGHKGCMKLPVASVLYTAWDGAVVDHYLQIPRSSIGCVNYAWRVSDKSRFLHLAFRPTFDDTPIKLHLNQMQYRILSIKEPWNWRLPRFCTLHGIVPSFTMISRLPDPALAASTRDTIDDNYYDLFNHKYFLKMSQKCNHFPVT